MFKNFKEYKTLKALEYYNSFTSRYNHKDAIIIAANPRGGSTWLSDLLSKLDNTTTLYEPLNLTHPEVKRLSLSWRQYMPQNGEWEELHAYLDKLFTGRSLDPWMTLHPMSRNKGLSSVLTTKTWLLKFCRLNLMLPWLVDNFDVRPPIFLLRHPCAVVASQIQYGEKYSGNWKTNAPHKTVLSARFPEYYEQYQEILDSINSQEGSLAALWCLTNKLPLDHEYNNKKWLTISYEEILLNREEVVDRIFERLGISVDDETKRSIIYSDDKSKTTINDSPVSKKKDQLSAWNNKLTDEQVEGVLRVVKLFGMDKYYDGNLEPNYKNIYSK